VADVEPPELCVDAVDALGSDTMEVGALGWVVGGDAAASVTVGADDPVE
jgi:hypothetical protein